MPALGSSVINKSGKKFAPKAPVRRPAAVTSTQPSGRENVERSQTPQASQSETIQHAVKPPNLASQAPDPNPGISVSETESPQGESSTDPKVTPNNAAAGGRITHIRSPNYASDASPQQAPARSELPTTAETACLAPHLLEVAQPRPPTPPTDHAPQSPICTLSTQDSGEVAPDLTSQPPAALPVQEERSQASHGRAPPAKRRKLWPGRAAKPLASQETPNVQIHIPPRPAEASSGTAAGSGDPSTGHARRGPTQPAPPKESSSKGKGRQRRAAAGADKKADTAIDSTQYVKDAQKIAKVTKSRRATTLTNRQRLQDAAAEIVADAVEGTATRRKGRRGTRERQPTPEEAENEMITPETIKMVELCKDTRRGRKSDMLKALQERDKEELVRKAQKELHQLVQSSESRDADSSVDQAVPGETNGGSERPMGDVLDRQEDVVREVADTYVDEHGQIRINTDSLQIDRHAQAAAAREQEQQEVVVENDLSKPAINSRTYGGWGKPKLWPEELTDEFYEALRMFGTDFGMIGRMLRKTRRAIKLKFNKEERVDPTRINQALLGARIAVDLVEYSRRAGEEITETEEHERKMEEDRKKIEENAADELRAKEQQEQLRREQAEQERTAIPDESSGKENRKAGKTKKKKKEKKVRDRKSRQKKGEIVAEVPPRRPIQVVAQLHLLLVDPNPELWCLADEKSELEEDEGLVLPVELPSPLLACPKPQPRVPDGRCVCPRLPAKYAPAAPAAAPVQKPGLHLEASAVLPEGMFSSMTENSRVQNPTKHSDEDDAEENRSKCAPGGAVHAFMVKVALAFVLILQFANIGENEPVLDSTAALQDIGIAGGFIAFTDDVGRTKLEFRGQGCGTSPLDVLIIVVGALVLTAHDIDVVQAPSVAADAFQLAIFQQEALSIVVGVLRDT
ncbi:MAG: hypothetical protein Q9216_000488 [Gyalolechia sp. 2 TL-2023]